MNKRLAVSIAAAAACALCRSVSATSVAERPAYFVEWLGSSGTQKIDTEYVFTTDPRVETTMMLTSNADRDVAGTSTANASCFIIDYNDAGKIIYYRYHAASYTAVTYPASILNQWVEAVWGSEVRHNGTVLKPLATQNFSDNTASFQLFYGRNGMTGRLKGVRMYDGNVLVRDFEPAVMSDGTPCMYDRVTDKCYLNSGTGTFSTGDPVFSSLTVEGSPFAVGVVSPPYGFHENELLVGTATNCSAPATVTAEGLSATCAGYRLYRWSENDANWALESSGAGNALSLAVTAADARLVWLWDVAADLAVSLDGAPSAEANSATIPVFVRGLGSPASPATLKLVYGFSRDALSFTNVVSSSVTDIGALSAPLSRLSPGINYYVKAILETNGGGERAESEIVRFQTPRCEELGKPGLWQTFFTSANKDWTKDIWAVPEGTDWQNYSDANRIRRRETTVIAPYTHGAAPSSCTKYVSEVWGDQVWWPVSGGQWVYAGYIYLEATKTYKFRTKIDDNERIQITDAGTGVTTTLINDTGNGSGVNTSAAYTPSVTGWHAIELRFSDGSGGLGGYDAANNYVNSNNLGFSQDGGSTWNLLKDPGDGSLLRLERGPSMVAEEVVANGALSSLSLSFDSSAASRTLLAAWGPAHGGNDPADWFATNAVATIAAGATSYNWSVPSDWGSDSNLVVRFYFDGDFIEWSNATFWRDYAAPTVADVALDGTGGDTLVVSGDLASFLGDTCTLNVYVGTTDGEPEYAWTGLAGRGMHAHGLHGRQPDDAHQRLDGPRGKCSRRPR